VDQKRLVAGLAHHLGQQLTGNIPSNVADALATLITAC